MPSLGDYIKAKRDENGLSLREFADKCGLSHSYIDGLEKGINPKTGKPMRPNLETMEKLALGLGISREELMVVTGYLSSRPSAVISSGDPHIPSIDAGESVRLIIEEPAAEFSFLAPLSDPELLEFWEELNKRTDLQRICKLLKSLSPEGIQRVIRYIQLVESDEESR